MLGLRVALAVADGLGFGGDVAPGAVVDGVGPDALHVPAAVGSADPLVDELPVVGVGVGVVVAGRPVERDAHAGVPGVLLEDLLEAVPGQVGTELRRRLGQDLHADPSGLGDVVVAGVAPLEALVLPAVGLDQLVPEGLLLRRVPALGVLRVGPGRDAPGRDRVGLVLDVLAEDRAVAGVTGQVVGGVAELRGPVLGAGVVHELRHRRRPGERQDEVGVGRA